LQVAIDASADGGTITVAPGTYGPTVATVDKNLTIVGLMLLGGTTAATPKKESPFACRRSALSEAERRRRIAGRPFHISSPLHLARCPGPAAWLKRLLTRSHVGSRRS
jgi:hypothetical protein